MTKEEYTEKIQKTAPTSYVLPGQGKNTGGGKETPNARQYVLPGQAYKSDGSSGYVAYGKEYRWQSGLKRIIDYAQDETDDFERTSTYLEQAQENLRQLQEAVAGGTLTKEESAWYNSMSESYGNVINYLTERKNLENGRRWQSTSTKLQQAQDTLDNLNLAHSQSYGTMTAAEQKQLDTDIENQRTVIEGLQQELDSYVQTNDERDALINKMHANAGFMKGGLTAAEQRRLRELDAELGNGEINYGKDFVRRGDLVWGMLEKGAGHINKAVTGTANWLFGDLLDEFKALGDTTLQGMGIQKELPNVVKGLDRWVNDTVARDEEYFGLNASSSSIAQTVDRYGTMTAEAIPMAVLAIMTGGASVGTQGLAAESAILQSSGVERVASIASTWLKERAADPNFQFTFVQAFGQGYEDAMDDGATNEEASLYALLNGIANAGIEISGGIQTLPSSVQAALKEGNQPALRMWAKSIADEMGEEVRQGMAENALKGLYKDVDLYSTENEDAIINPKRMAEEASGAAVVAAILGGGQVGVEKGRQSIWQQTQAKAQQRGEATMKAAEEVAMTAIRKESPVRGITFENADLQDVHVTFEGKDLRFTGFTNENGKVMAELQLPSGQSFTVDPKRVDFREDTDMGKFLKEISRQDHPEVMLMMFSPTVQNENGETVHQDAGAFIQQWNIAEKVYGRLSSKMTKEGILKAPGLDALTGAQKQAAWEIGRAEQEAAIKEGSLPEGVDLKSMKPGQGQVSYDGANLDGVQYKAVDRANLNDTQRSQISVIESLAKATGLNFVFYQSETDSGGVYRGANGVYRDGVIYLDVNAGLTMQKDGRTMGEIAIVRTAAHEMTHFIKEFNPAEYETLKGYIVDVLLENQEYLNEMGVRGTTPDETFDALVAQKQNRDRSGNLSYEDAVDEVIADGCEMMLRNTQAIERLAAEQPGIARRIRDWIRDWVAKIREAFRGVDAQHVEAKALLENAEELQQRWDSALEGAARRYGEARRTGTETKTAASERAGGTKFDIRVEQGPSARTGSKNTAGHVLADHLAELKEMQAVKSLTGTEMNDRTKDLPTQIEEFFNSVGGKVEKVGLGTVYLGEYGVGGIMNHKPLNRAKMVTLAAVPEVIQHGRIINYDPNWKGRGYPSLIIAAPVDVAGEPIYVAAVIDQREDYKFYLNECVDSNGNYVRITEDPSGNTKSGVTAQDGVTRGPNGSTEPTLPQTEEKSKGKKSVRSEPGPEFREREETAKQLQADVQEYFQSVDPNSEQWLSEEEITDAMEFNSFGNKQHGYLNDGDLVLQNLSEISKTLEGDERSKTYELMERILMQLSAGTQNLWTNSTETRAAVNQDFVDWYNEKHPSLYYPGYQPGDLFQNAEKMKQEVSYLNELMDSGKLSDAEFEEAWSLQEDLEYSLRFHEMTDRFPKGKSFYSVREEWANELDRWLKETEDNPDIRTTSHGYFKIGRTSDVLKELGVKDTTTYWRKYKIGEILEDHPEISPDIIKQVPEMMEHPAFVMKSLTRDNSITMIGTLKAENGDNVMAALELTPKAGGISDAEFSLLTTAHGRAKARIVHLLENSELLYLDEQIIRAGTWSMQLRVQFPSGQPSYGSVGNVTYEGKSVKITGKKLSELGGEVIEMEANEAEKTVAKAVDRKGAKDGGMAEAFRRALDQKALKSEREYTLSDTDLVRSWAARPEVHDETLGKWLKKQQTADALRMKLQDHDESIRAAEQRIREGKARDGDAEWLEKLRTSRANTQAKLNRTENTIRGLEKTQAYRRALSMAKNEWMDTDPRQAQKTIRELREANRQLEEYAQYWKDQARIHGSGEQRASRKDVEAYAKKLMTDNNFAGDRAQLTGQLQEMADYIASGNHGNGMSSAELQSMAADIADELVSGSYITLDDNADLRKQLQASLSEMRIRPDEEWTGDFGDWADFRRKQFGKLVFAKDGQSIDEVYHQLNGEFGDGLFPPEVTAGSDQVYQILAALDSLRPTEVYAFGDGGLEAIARAELESEIYEQMLFGDIGNEQTLAERNIQSLGERLRKAEQEAREGKKSIAELKKMQRFEIRAALEDQRARIREREQKEKLRKNIDKTGKRLLKYLTDNSGKNPIPEPMKKAVGSLLMDLDLSRGMVEKEKNRYRQRMQEVVNIVGKQAAYLQGTTDEWDGLTVDLPDDLQLQMSEHLRKVNEQAEILEATGQTWNPNMMSTEELAELDEILTTVSMAIQNANEILSDHAGAKLDVEAGDGMRYLESLGRDKNRGEKADKLNKFLRFQNTSPYYFFRKFGEPGLKMFERIQDGWDKFAFNAKKVLDFSEATYTAKEAKEIQETVFEFQLRKRGDVTSPNMEKPETVTMTKAQIMSLYCLWKRKQARGHLAGAGIRIADYRSGRSTVTQADNYLLDLEDVAKITGVLTERDRQIADALQKYMNTQGSDWGNEVSMKRFGIRSFTEENYFPIRTDDRSRQLRNPESDSANLYRLLNMSFTKNTVREASNSVVLDDIFDVFSNHMADMAKYNGLGLPMLDAMRWFSYQRTSELSETGQYGYESIQKAAERAYGKEARNYFVTFMKDLNGTHEAGRGEEFGSAIMSNYKVAAVGANLRVAVLQPTSYVRALAVIDKKYLVRGLRMSNKAGRAEAQKYSGTAVWKALGFYDTNINAGLREMIKHTDGLRENLQEISMKGAETGDQITWGALWNACKAEQADKGYAGDILMKETAKRFREVVYRTQVMDSTMTRSHMMRQKGVYAGMITAFMSEPTLSYNMLLDAYGEYEAKLRQGMNRTEAWQQSRNHIKGAVTAYLSTAALAAIVESLIDAARDDDEYMTYLERFSSALLGKDGNLVQDMLVHNKLPVIKDMFSILGGGQSTSRMDQEWLTTFYRTFNIWKESIALQLGLQEEPTSATYNGAMSTWGKIYTTLKAASQISGLPLANASRDAVALWNSTVGEFARGLKIQTYDPGEEKKIKYAVKDGYLTEDEAVEWMLHYDLADSEEDARQQVFLWSHEDEDGQRYSRLFAAIGAGDDTEFRAAMDELSEYGFNEKTTEAAIRSEIQKGYLGEDGGARLGKEQTVDLLVKYGGWTEDVAKKKVQEWTCQVVTGIPFSKIDDAFLAGEITQKRAEEMLITYGGYDSEKAHETMQKAAFTKDTGYELTRTELQSLYTDGTYSRGEMKRMMLQYGYSATEESAEHSLVRWDFVGNDMSLDDISYTEAQAWYDTMQGMGFSKKAWLQFCQETDEKAMPADYDANGKGISGSRQKKVWAYIDSLDLTVEQKDALHCYYWSPKTAKKAPWH